MFKDIIDMAVFVIFGSFGNWKLYVNFKGFNIATCFTNQAGLPAGPGAPAPAAAPAPRSAVWQASQGSKLPVTE